LDTAPRLGFIGVGAMGGAMARNLLAAGYPLTAFDISGERLAAIVAAGAERAESAAEVARRCDIVLTSLRSSAIFVEVAQGELLPNARAGQAFIDLGTTAPPETRRLAAAFAARGATLLDVPVSGGPHGIETRTLRMFAGGDRAAFDRCRRLLEALGGPKHIVYCGPGGCGQIVKGVNQLAMGLGDAAYMEALAFGVRAGVDPEAIREAVGGDDGFRRHFAAIAGRVVEGKGESLWVKFPELPYFLAEAAEQGVPLPLAEALYTFLSAVEPRWRDNMARPTASFWHELASRRLTGGADGSGV